MESDYGSPIAVNATESTVTINISNKHYHNPASSTTPSLEAIRQMIDAVIATTEDKATAGRLELCRAYLFNPLLGDGIERLMLEALGKHPLERISRKSK